MAKTIEEQRMEVDEKLISDMIDTFQMYREGTSMVEIANKLNRPESVVRKWIGMYEERAKKVLEINED